MSKYLVAIVAVITAVWFIWVREPNPPQTVLNVTISDEVIESGGGIYFVGTTKRLMGKLDMDGNPYGKTIERDMRIDAPYSIVRFSYYERDGSDYTISFFAETPENLSTPFPKTKLLSYGGGWQTIMGDTDTSKTFLLAPESLTIEDLADDAVLSKYIDPISNFTRDALYLLPDNIRCEGSHAEAAVCIPIETYDPFEEDQRTRRGVLK